MPRRAGGGPIHAVLDAAGIPWRSTRAELAERFGIARHPAYDWEVIEIASANPVCTGLIWPISVQVFAQFSPRMPATRFTGVASFGTDARENLRLTFEQFLPRLGKPTASGASNTIERHWRFAAASLTLTVWPPDMQPRSRRMATTSERSAIPRVQYSPAASGCSPCCATARPGSRSALPRAPMKASRE